MTARFFPTREVPADEWHLRVRSAGAVMVRDNDGSQPRVGLYGPRDENGVEFALTVHVLERNGAFRIGRIEIRRTQIGAVTREGPDVWSWRDGPLDQVIDSSWLGERIHQCMALLFDGEIPSTGQIVMLPDGRRGTVLRVAVPKSDPDQRPRPLLPPVAQGTLEKGGHFEAPVAELRLTGELGAILEPLHSAGQPVVHDGQLGVVERVERGESLRVRLRIKVDGRKAFWTDADVVQLPDGWTDLHTAALGGPSVPEVPPDDNAARAALLKPARVGPIGKRNGYLFPADSTPLHVAFFTGAVGLVERLRAAGAAMDATDADGRVPLYYAAIGHPDSVTWAVQNGFGAAVAGFVLQRNDTSRMVLLVRAGFDPDQTVGGTTLRQAMGKAGTHQQARDAARALRAAEAEKSPYVHDTSKSSKTKCQRCRKKILKGQPMIGHVEVKAAGTKRRWYHPECARAEFGLGI